MMACKAGKTDVAADARRLFAQDCLFVMGAASYDQIPSPTIDEIAFAGRSNVGKSSLINALLGRKIWRDPPTLLAELAKSISLIFLTISCW